MSDILRFSDFYLFSPWFTVWELFQCVKVDYFNLSRIKKSSKNCEACIFLISHDCNINIAKIKVSSLNHDIEDLNQES